MSWTFEQKAIHTVTHWIRDENIHPFPLELVGIIAAYYKFILTWSATKHGDGVTFIEDNRIKIDGSGKENSYALCCTNQCISHREFDIFSWELIFHRKCTDSLPGFVAVDPGTLEIIIPEDEDIDVYHSAPFEIGGACLNLHHGDTMWVCNAENSDIKRKQNSSITIPELLSDGAKIGFRANFTDDTMEVFYNGVDQGVRWCNIPKQFVIITATCLGVDEVEIIFRDDHFGQSK